jgi:hypothetical protein
VDPTTRRLTAIALALAVVATVYAVTGDWLKAGISMVGVAACLLWGFWPDLRRKRGLTRAGGVSFTLKVDRAGYSQKMVSNRRVSVLRLTLLVQVSNDTDGTVTVRPSDPELVRPERWRRTKPLPVTFEPVVAIDPAGRVADYGHFPEGQYLIPARSERSHYFFFNAIADAGDEFLNRSLMLRVTIRLPGPHRVTVPLPPVAYS